MRKRRVSLRSTLSTTATVNYNAHHQSTTTHHRRRRRLVAEAASDSELQSEARIKRRRRRGWVRLRDDRQSPIWSYYRHSATTMTMTNNNNNNRQRLCSSPIQRLRRSLSLPVIQCCCHRLFPLHLSSSQPPPPPRLKPRHPTTSSSMGRRLRHPRRRLSLTAAMKLTTRRVAGM